MKNVVIIVRWIVGLLFLFSGIVKVNDPMGLSYKMQEFFEIWGCDFLNSFSLPLSIIMNVFEVGCGIALIIGFRIQLTIKLLLATIVFFTFLTGYAALSGKVKTCGCLGDCLPLTPITSFVKDVVLLAMIVFIAFNTKFITPIFNRFITGLLLTGFIFISLIVEDAALNYLPFVDCLPYKVGNNILTQMQKPSNYKPDSIVINYQYKRKGVLVEFDQNHFPDDFDSTYEYVGRNDKLIQKGTGEPKITDFSLINANGVDTSKFLFEIPKYVMVMGNAFPPDFKKFSQELSKTKFYCDNHKISFFYVSSQSDEEIKLLTKKNITVLKCDATLIKTAARVNSTYFLMNGATIAHKFSDRDHERVMQILTSF